MAEPITSMLVLSALGAGAAALAKGVLGEAGKEAYSKLKGMILERFKSDQVGLTALEKFEDNPAGWEAPLRDSLTDTGVAADPLIQEQARKVIQIVQAQQVTQAKNNVTIEGNVQGAIFGDHAQQTNEFKA
jgi:hypothetical protein